MRLLMKDDVLRSGDGDWEKITICAFASRERGFGDLGRGILCSQGFGKPPLLVGLVTKMADTSNGDRFPLSINIPSAFLTVAANQMKVNANQNKMIPHLRTGVPADEGTFPYAVSIWPTGVLHFCNGALISSKHVLTVASCVERAYRYPSKVICKIGDIHIHDDERCPEAESLTASKIMMSPRQGHKKGKLAIIVLETESKKAPLLLPEAGQPNRHLMKSYVRSCRCRLLQEWTRRVRLWLGTDVSWPRVFTDPPARKRQMYQSRDLPRQVFFQGTKARARRAVFLQSKSRRIHLQPR